MIACCSRSPFNAPLHLGQEVVALKKREDGRFDVETITGTRFDAGAVVIAGGVGSFQPRRIGVGAGAASAHPRSRGWAVCAGSGRRQVTALNCTS